MTDPDERTINRAIALVGDYVPDELAPEQLDELQDIREEARAALHRLFRDRRRLENELASQLTIRETNEAELARLREENETHKEAHEALLNHCENLGVDNFRQREEITRLREALERLRQQSENKSEAIVTLLAALREIALADWRDWSVKALIDVARAAIVEVEGEK